MDFNKCFEDYTTKYGNCWGMNWRAYMIKRVEKTVNICKKIITDISSSDYSIVEVGCATGDFTNELVKLVDDKKGKIIAGDIATNAIEICKDRFSDYNNLQFKIMSLPNIDIEKNADFAICMDVLEYFAEEQWADCMENIASLSNKYVLIQMPLNGINVDAFINCFDKCFSNVKIDYVYGQIWYSLFEKRLAGIVQNVYISPSKNIFKRFIGFCGYKILSWKFGVNLFFGINEVFFKKLKTHIILVGEVK